MSHHPTPEQDLAEEARQMLRDQAEAHARQILQDNSYTAHRQRVAAGQACPDCWTTSRDLHQSILTPPGVLLCRPCQRARDRKRITTVLDGQLHRVYAQHPRSGRPVFRGTITAAGIDPNEELPHQPQMVWQLTSYDSAQQQYVGDFIDAALLLLGVTTELDLEEL